MEEDDDDVPTCPLCLEELDATDRAVKACQCGYQVCLWCLHTIREQLNQRCPACRTPYEEQNFQFDDVNPEQAAKEAKERKTAKKERERREKLRQTERERARAIVLSQQKAKSNLKHARILQRNLVYVIGLSLTLAREEVLRRADMFGKFGRMIRVLVNRSHPFNADAPGGPSISAYVQYYRDADALAAVRAMNNAVFDGREIRCAIATTKYCDTFVLNIQASDPPSAFHYCNNANCLYFHTTAHSDTVLTREEVLARQLGPPPPAHLFLPPLPRRPTYPPYARPANSHTSSQPANPTIARPLPNRAQSNAPPTPTSSAQAPPVSSTSSPTRRPLHNSPFSPPSSPDSKRHTPRLHRSPLSTERPPLDPAILSTSAPSPSAILLPSSSMWASTQPGHPVARSPGRHSPPSDQSRAPSRQGRDVPPGFEATSPSRRSPPPPSRPPGFGTPPVSRLTKTDPKRSPFSSSPRRPFSEMSSSAAASTSLPDSPPPGFGPPSTSVGDGEQDARQKEAAAWLQHASADEVFSVNQKRTSAPVGNGGFGRSDDSPVVTAAPSSNTTNRDRSGLEKVLANIGDTLGVSSQFQSLSVASENSISAGGVDGYSRRDVKSSLFGQSSEAHANSAHRVVFNEEKARESPGVQPAHGSRANPANPGLPSNPPQKGVDIHGVQLPKTGRRNFSRFGFAQDNSSVVKTSGNMPVANPREGRMKQGHDREKVHASGIDSIKTLGGGMLSNDFVDVVQKKPSAIRHSRSRFDFADRGRSPSRNGSIKASRSETSFPVNRSFADNSREKTGGMVSLTSVPESLDEGDVFGALQQMTTEEKLASIFTSAKLASNMPPMPSYEHHAEELLHHVPMGVVSTSSAMSAAIGSDASTMTASISGVRSEEAEGEVSKAAHSLSVGHVPNCAVVNESRSVESAAVGAETAGVPPPGFREATPGITPETTAGEGPSETTGVASSSVVFDDSSGGKNNSSPEASSNEAFGDPPVKEMSDLGNERASSTEYGNLEEDRKRNRNQRRRDRKVRAMKDTEARVGLEVQEGSRGDAPGLEVENRRSDKGRSNVKAVSNELVETKTSNVGQVRKVEVSAVAPSLPDVARAGDKGQWTKEDEEEKKGNSLGRDEAGSGEDVGDEVAGESEKNLEDVEDGCEPFHNSGEQGRLSMSVSELEREVAVARVREAQLQDELMEIDRRLRSYDNIRT